VPYLKFGRKKEVRSERRRANTDGDFNYLFTLEYLEAFTANPSYATIAKIAKAAIQPKWIEGVLILDDYLTVNGVPLIDRQAARLLAFVEFYRRIGAKYEEECITRNGDLAEYREAELAIQKKFAAEAK
jgi:hypothetical protein